MINFFFGFFRVFYFLGGLSWLFYSIFGFAASGGKPNSWGFLFAAILSISGLLFWFSYMLGKRQEYVRRIIISFQLISLVFQLRYFHPFLFFSVEHSIGSVYRYLILHIIEFFILIASLVFFLHPKVKEQFK